MDFLSKGIMTGRARLSRIIQVKPYNPSGDENDDDEGEKENIRTSSLPNAKSPLLYNETTDTAMPSRTRSLEHIPGDKIEGRDSPDLAILGRTKSFERNHVGVAIGSPEMAPVFTTTNSNFTVVKNHLTTKPHKKLTVQKSPIKRRAKW